MQTCHSHSYFLPGHQERGMEPGEETAWMVQPSWFAGSVPQGRTKSIWRGHGAFPAFGALCWPAGAGALLASSGYKELRSVSCCTLSEISPKNHIIHRKYPSLLRFTPQHLVSQARPLIFCQQDPAGTSFCPSLQQSHRCEPASISWPACWTARSLMSSNAPANTLHKLQVSFSLCQYVQCCSKTALYAGHTLLDLLKDCPWKPSGTGVSQGMSQITKQSTHPSNSSQHMSWHGHTNKSLAGEEGRTHRNHWMDEAIRRHYSTWSNLAKWGEKE